MRRFYMKKFLSRQLKTSKFSLCEVCCEMNKAKLTVCFLSRLVNLCMFTPTALLLVKKSCFGNCCVKFIIDQAKLNTGFFRYDNPIECGCHFKMLKFCPIVRFYITNACYARVYLLQLSPM